MDKKNPIFVGIRREDKSCWERRVPLIPKHVKDVMKQNPHIKFIVQPSNRRIFADCEYEEAGAILSDDLSKCNFIICVKEVPINQLFPLKTYLYFSHTIKAQDYNMPTLDHILANKIRLIDYEKITNEKGERLIAFGRYAGIAGTIDFLGGIGQYLLKMGFTTPFLHISPSYKYFNLEQAYKHITSSGIQLIKEQIPIQICPLIFAVTGTGRCSYGALEVLKLLPIQMINPNEMQKIYEDKNNPKHQNTIYVTMITSEFMVAEKNGRPFDKKDYYEHPSNYKPIFHEKYLPYISVIFHNMYWDQRFPRLIETQQLKQIALEGKNRLLGICDVTCDYKGSIEFLTKFTTPDSPFFIYNIIDNKITDEIEYKQNSLLYQAVDFLPCELAYDASTHFSNILKDWIANIAESDINLQFDEQNLTPEIKRAVITWNGSLTPNFKYIEQLRHAKASDARTKSSYMPKTGNFTAIKLIGHLFRTLAINKIIDTCIRYNIAYNCTDIKIGNKKEEASSAVLQMFSTDPVVMSECLTHIDQIVDQNKLILEDLLKTREQNVTNSSYRMKL